MQNYEAFKRNLINQPSVHNWVKDNLTKLDDHDVVDVLRGLELLQSAFQMKLNGLTAKHR